MLKAFARWWARRRYIFKQDFEATLEELQAALSAQRAQEKRDAAAQLRKDAEDMESRVKEMAEMEERGFWLCENGHEHADVLLPETIDDLTRRCLECKSPAKLICRDLMTGQEKYESDKQRKEVETMIANKRQLAEQYDKDAKGGDETAKHFTKQAASSRDVAERLRKL
jgi:hypothetical protein